MNSDLLSQLIAASSCKTCDKIIRSSKDFIQRRRPSVAKSFACTVTCWYSVTSCEIYLVDVRNKEKMVALNQNGVSFVDPEGYPLTPHAEKMFGQSFNKTEDLNLEQICSINARSKIQPNKLTSNNISKVHVRFPQTVVNCLSRERKLLLVPSVKCNEKEQNSKKCSHSSICQDSSIHLKQRICMSSDSNVEYNCRLKFSNLQENSYRSHTFRIPTNFTNNRNKRNERLLGNKNVDDNTLTKDSFKGKTKASTGKRLVVINTWEEFYYGISVLETKRTSLPGITSFTEKLHRTFDRFLSRAFVEFLVALVYFSIFFLTCLIYNMFWQFIGYVLLTGHLQIHEQACLRKIDIRFTGSVFQGPAYVYMRQVWCAHCAQKSTEKITLRLAKDFREEYEKRKKFTI